MTNVVRKELRKILDMLGQLEKHCSEYEKLLILNARISIVQADYHDFHLNPKKYYKEPKSDFNYEC